MLKTVGALAVLLSAWTMFAYGRDLDKGTVTGDGTGHPPPHWASVNSRLFIPNDPQVYFKLINTTDETVTLQHVRVRLATAEDDFNSGDGGSLPACATSQQIVPESPIRTVVTERELPIEDSQLSLNIELMPCESILIQATGATPGAEHIVTIGVDLESENPGPGFMEIWDGDCND